MSELDNHWYNQARLKEERAPMTTTDDAIASAIRQRVAPIMREVDGMSVPAHQPFGMYETKRLGIWSMLNTLAAEATTAQRYREALVDVAKAIQEGCVGITEQCGTDWHESIRATLRAALTDTDGAPG